jgi:hypothetical protein
MNYGFLGFTSACSLALKPILANSNQPKPFVTTTVDHLFFVTIVLVNRILLTLEENTGKYIRGRIIMA